jgi:hypothetical protein
MPDPDRYATVISDLSALLAQKAFVEQQRVRIETETVYRLIGEGASVASAQREADFYALEHRLSVIDLEAKIAVLELQKELLCRS